MIVTLNLLTIYMAIVLAMWTYFLCEEE